MWGQPASAKSFDKNLLGRACICVLLQLHSGLPKVFECSRSKPLLFREALPGRGWTPRPCVSKAIKEACLLPKREFARRQRSARLGRNDEARHPFQSRSPRPTPRNRREGCARTRAI